jgi:DNA polymerase III epsilon subunit-like protein
MSLNNIMLDFETLGNTPSTAVMSLGAVVFDQNKILAEKYWLFDMNGQIKNGRTVKVDTLIWWMSQGDSAKTVFKQSQEHGILIRDFLPQFVEFLKPFSNLRVWGNGANFDVSIIENIFDTASMKTPWLFYNTRCYRTMKSCFGIEKGGQFKGTKHNALDDARNQANYLLEYWKTNPEACK